LGDDWWHRIEVLGIAHGATPGKLPRARRNTWIGMRRGNRTPMSTPGSDMPGTAVDRTAVYDDLLAGVVRVIEDARRAAARSVNVVMTATYWLIGQPSTSRGRMGRQCLPIRRVPVRGRRPRRFGRHCLPNPPRPVPPLPSPSPGPTTRGSCSWR